MKGGGCHSSFRWITCTACTEFNTKSQGRISEEGIWHLGAKILGSSVFAVCRKKRPSKIHLQEIHLPKFRNSTQKSGNKFTLHLYRVMSLTKFEIREIGSIQIREIGSIPSPGPHGKRPAWGSEDTLLSARPRRLQHIKQSCDRRREEGCHGGGVYSAARILHVMWSFPAKFWQKNARSYFCT